MLYRVVVIIILLFFVLYRHGSNVHGGRLLQAHIVFRHGNRTPTGTFPNDIHKESAWKEGFGELTDLGKKNSFILGSVLNQRYIQTARLVSATYDKNIFSIISTDSNRTLATATLVLAGLFPLDSPSALGYPIQPVPIRYIPNDIDILLKSEPKNCPKLTGLYMKLFMSREFQEAQKKYAPFFEQLSTLSGWTVNFLNVVKLYQALKIEKSYSMPLVDWATDRVLAKLDEVYRFRLKSYIKFDDELYRKLVGGSFLYKIKSEMESIIEGKSSQRMFLYSAHDTTIEKLFAAMQIPEYEPVSFNGALAFELYEVLDKHFIRIMYRNSNEGFRQITLPGKKDQVLFDEFCKMYENVISSTVMDDCQN